jgi:8-oxo-dGTP diphosphatase
VNQQVSVSGIADRHGAVLVLRRSKRERFLPGVFELPGGKLRFGESPEAALHREFCEETGMDVYVVRLVHARSYLSKSGAQHNIELFYTVQIEDDDSDVRLSAAHDEYRWIHSDELELIGLPPEDAIRKFIQSYFASSKISAS